MPIFMVPLELFTNGLVIQSFLYHINLHNLFINSVLVPGQPGKFRVGKIRDTSIELMWDPPFSKEPIKSYELIYRAAKHSTQVRHLIITVIRSRAIRALQKLLKQDRLQNCVCTSLSVWCNLISILKIHTVYCLHPKLLIANNFSCVFLSFKIELNVN